MALTFLNPAMIDQPANINFLSAGNFISTNASLIRANISSANIGTLSAYNFFANNIINNTDLFGNLTIYGGVTALSGFNVVNTSTIATTALSVVNIGAGPALYIAQGNNINGVAIFVGSGQELLRVNNIDPDLGQASVVVTKGLSNKALSANGTSIFDNIESSNATINQLNATNFNATSADINVLSNNILIVDTINSNIVNSNSVSADSIVVPPGSNSFFGNITVYGQINALSGIQNISSFITETSALSVVNTGATPALFVKQAANPGAVASFIGSNVEVLRINNPSPTPPVVGIVVTGNVSASNVMYAAGGNSNNWNNVFTNVQTNSGNWTSTYTNVQANSGNWQATYTNVDTNSTNWNNTYTIVQNNSNRWTSVFTNVQANSANWQSTYNTVQNTSASWNGGLNALTNIQSNSAFWTPSKILTGGNFFAQANLRYLVDTSLSAIYCTLPPTPLTGSVISFEDPFGTWDTNNLIIFGNGRNIESSTNALSCDIEDSAFDLTFVGGMRGWKVS